MDFSIIVTTYNGSKYLVEQLDSLRLQTKTPLEVCIFDDKSTDGTQELVQSYIKRYELPWIFCENEQNLGWKKNYLLNIPRTQGEVVFLCDQDDIWLPEKCELMMDVMESYPDCNVLLSNYYPYVMPGGPPVSRRSRNHSDNRTVRKVQPTMKTMQATLRPGCTYCIRRNFFDFIVSKWNGELSHDGFLFYMGLLTDSTYLFNYRSIRFRRHADNNSPLIQITVKGLMHNIGQIERLMEFHEQYLDSHATADTPIKRNLIARIRRGCAVRYLFLDNPSLLLVLKLIVRHHALYLSPKAMVRDIRIAFRSRKEERKTDD